MCGFLGCCLFGANEINRCVFAGFCQQPAQRLDFSGGIYS
jgi:hypothetical protein